MERNGISLWTLHLTTNIFVFDGGCDDGKESVKKGNLGNLPPAQVIIQCL